jgi:peroxiredoxin
MLEAIHPKRTKEIMQIKLCSPRPLRASLRLARKNAGSLMVLMGIFMLTPACVGQQDVHATPTSPESRKQAPDFQLVTADGTKVRLSDYRGKVVLVNFWATGCGGCVLEIPSFIEIEKIYKGSTFNAVGVSMDMSYEGRKSANEAWNSVRPFMKKYGINYTIAMGDDAISRDYAVNTIPATYLIDKSGRIAVAYVGMLINKDDVATKIKSLLSEQ